MEALFRVLGKLQEDWGVKIFSSCAVSLVAAEHAQIFAAFCALVCADLATKFLSLSRKHLVDGGNPVPTFWRTVCNIRAARRAGYIKSNLMRTRFVPKILTYFGVVAVAVLLDFILVKTHAPAFAATLAIGYLSLTEFISILENMQASGVEEAGALLELARKKSGAAGARREDKSERREGK